jgi:hypothetical protein
VAIRRPSGPFDSILLYRKMATRVVGVALCGPQELIALLQFRHIATNESTAPRLLSGSPTPRAPHSPQLEPQRKSRQQSSLFTFCRRLNEVKEQATEGMEAAEAKAAAE